MQDDRRLARRMQQGERRAYAEFVDAYGGRVHRLVRRMVANAADAEDVTQEIFCDLYRSIGRFRGDAALSTWVYRIADNHCLRHGQRARPENLPLDEQLLPDPHWQSDPSQAAAKGELSDQVQAALSELTPGHSDVVVLCELHGLTYQECAHLLGIPVGTVKSRLSNAFRRLRVRLGSYVLEEGSGQPVTSPGEKA